MDPIHPDPPSSLSNRSTERATMPGRLATRVCDGRGQIDLSYRGGPLSVCDGTGGRPHILMAARPFEESATETGRADLKEGTENVAEEEEVTEEVTKEVTEEVPEEVTEEVTEEEVTEEEVTDEVTEEEVTEEEVTKEVMEKVAEEEVTEEVTEEGTSRPRGGGPGNAPWRPRTRSRRSR